MKAKTAIIKVVNIITVISIFTFLPYICSVAQAGEEKAKPEEISAPSGLNIISADIEKIELEWQDNSDNEDGFNIFRRNDTKEEKYEVVDTIEANATTYSDRAVIPNNKYRYRVQAYNFATKSAMSNLVMTIAGELPAEPSDLTVVSAAEDKIEISWQDSSDNETGFEIWRKNVTEKTKYEPIDTVGAGVTGYIDTDVSPDVNYAYFIRAFHIGAKSKASKPVRVVAGFPPASPSGIEITSERVDIRWVDNSDNEDGFKIWRKNMEIEDAKYEVIGQVKADETSYTDETATPGVKYAYVVRVFNNAGYSEWGQPAIITPAGLPAKPTGLKAISVNSGEVEISWQDNSDDENGFEILRLNTAEGGDFKAIDTVSNEVTTYIDKNVAPKAS